ncbi:MAG: YjbQ family protein [Proteobacteria bacterium]|nr:MAG: YjbQ family protein [Pseudomonadota bacterium]MBC6944073.1 YjbQ family protein [Gammaproteobacteria bacterium]MCL4775988.1 secondary thiamine-phosphate synthase enzyme YjbQ [Gammaproteobacteria bacterium]MCQ3934916.1 YjbQ family protein [Gammaproteobacteria bacterium]MDL1880391.1 YjbQ family protein [Gammaproteobacteria bacterium PRO2]
MAEMLCDLCTSSQSTVRSGCRRSSTALSFANRSGVMALLYNAAGGAPGSFRSTDRLFTHTAEGPDDMPAHVRSVLTGNSLVVPVSAGRLALGTWQGLYLWEHRRAGSRRRVLVTVIG